MVSSLETLSERNCKVHTVTRHRVHQRHEMERRAAFVLLGMLYLAGTLVTVQAGETYPLFRIAYHSPVHLFLSFLYLRFYPLFYTFVALSYCTPTRLSSLFLFFLEKYSRLKFFFKLESSHSYTNVYIRPYKIDTKKPVVASEE